MTGIAFRKKDLFEKIDGYDEDLSMGEYADIRIRMNQLDYEQVNLDFESHEHYRKNFREVLQQGRWYGKTYMDFVKKYNSRISGLLGVFYFSSIFFIGVAAIFFPLMRYLFLLQLLSVLYISLEAYRVTGIKYALFIPLVKFIRSLGMLPGILAYLAKDVTRFVKNFFEIDSLHI